MSAEKPARRFWPRAIGRLAIAAVAATTMLSIGYYIGLVAALSGVEPGAGLGIIVATGFLPGAAVWLGLTAPYFARRAREHGKSDVLVLVPVGCVLPVLGYFVTCAMLLA